MVDGEDVRTGYTARLFSSVLVGVGVSKRDVGRLGLGQPKRDTTIQQRSISAAVKGRRAQ